MIYEFKKPNKLHPNPFLKYESFSVMKNESEKYPTMVTIHKAPAWAKSMIGKNYINTEKAIKAIDIWKGEYAIRKLGNSVAKVANKDLVELGLADSTAYAW